MRNSMTVEKKTTRLVVALDYEDKEKWPVFNKGKVFIFKNKKRQMSLSSPGRFDENGCHLRLTAPVLDIESKGLCSKW